MSEIAKDVTSATFGWVIAYILPGLLAIFTIALLSPVVANQLLAFSESDSTIGLFLLVLLTCLMLGLEVALVRWAIFECVACRGTKLTAVEMKSVREPEKFVAFKAVVDEHYKYHQFYGGIAVVLPFFVGALVIRNGGVVGWAEYSLVLLAVVLEVATIIGAIDCFTKYVERARVILT